jgi:hypothetical protein
MFGSYVKRLHLEVSSSAARRGAANVPCNQSDDGSAHRERSEQRDLFILPADRVSEE